MPDADVSEVPDNFGIFGRTTLNILNILTVTTGYKNCLLTVSLAQANYKEPWDLITKRPIFIDQTTNDLAG